MKIAIIIRVANERDRTYSSADFHGFKHFENESDTFSFLSENSLLGKKLKTYENKTLDIKLLYLPTEEYNNKREFYESIFEKGFSSFADEDWNENKDEEDNDDDM